MDFEDKRSPRRRRPQKSARPEPAAAPASVPPTPEERIALGGDLLAAVSRSFSLTIRLLPEPLRGPISVGYLLARALDTIADRPEIPAAARLEHLRALLAMIKLGADPELLRPLQRALSASGAPEGEQELIRKLDRCLAWLEALPANDIWDLRRTLSRIGYGQELDLIRFGAATAQAPVPLATARELDDYTYFVAGCVGELWTRLCERHLPPGWSALPTGEMLELGKRFGQGLQMVNVLRDLPSDLATGRCYLPADLLAAHGLEVRDLLAEPARARPLFESLRQLALGHLDAAWRYVRALKPHKLRYACALPVLIGLETLALLGSRSPLEAPERIKVTRTQVRGLMASALVGTAVSPWLSSLHSRVRGRAGKKN